MVNLHGQLKKASLQERVEFADKHLDEIHDSADNPLTVLLPDFLTITPLRYVNSCYMLILDSLNLFLLEAL